MTPRPVVPPWLVVGAALGASSLAGLAMAYGVKPGIAVAVALGYVPLVLINLRLAIVLWIPSVSLIAVGALDIGPNLAGMLIVGAWVGTLVSRRSAVAELVVANARLFGFLAALVLWVMLSVAWAPESPVGDEVFFGWLVNGAIVLVVATTLTSPGYLRLAAGAFVVGVLISVAIGLLGGAVQDDTERLTGGSGDPNFLAAGIVPAIVLAAGLGAGTRRLTGQATAVAAIGLLTIGLAATESRGGFVAAIVAGIAILVLAKKQRAWVVAMLLCVVGVAGIWFTLDPSAWERFSDFGEDTGRTELWTVAWQMWQDHAVLGVGLGGFLDSAAGYVRELGPLDFAEFIAEQPHVVHNTYLEVLAQTGIVGLVLFVTLAVASLRSALRAATWFDGVGDTTMATLSRSVAAALVAMLAAATFLSASIDRRLWLLLALGPALLAAAGGVSRRRSPRHTTAGDPQPHGPASHGLRRSTPRDRRRARGGAAGERQG